MAIVFPLYVVFIYAALALSLLFYIALHGEARDQRVPIHKCFGAMKGNLLRATGSFVGVAFLFYFLYGLLFVSLSGAILSASTTVITVIFVMLFALSVLFNFALVSFGAVFANKLIPGLRQ